ncbi:MAG: hypothetical protein ACK4E8_05460 [Lacibacter sp.]
MGLALSFAGLTALAADRQQNNDAGIYCTTVTACGQTTAMCMFTKGEPTQKQIDEAIAQTKKELCKSGASLETVEAVSPDF